MITKPSASLVPSPAQSVFSRFGPQLIRRSHVVDVVVVEGVSKKHNLTKHSNDNF